MNELIKRAFEVHDALRDCVASDGEDVCNNNCIYHGNGCCDTLMLDAAKVIGRLIEEVDNENTERNS